MPDTYYGFFMSIGFFFFTLGVLSALAVSLVFLKLITGVVDYFWPKPKETKDGKGTSN